MSANRQALATTSSNVVYAPTLVAVPTIPVAPPTPLSRFRGIVAFGIATIAIFIVGFGSWSAFAPLESAAIASGLVESESKRKTIQHFEGGIVGAILVNDGDLVAEGQPLIRLDDVQARSLLATLKGQLWDAQAREARLLAERDARTTIEYPAVLLQQASDPAVQLAIAGQNKIFETRSSVVGSKTALIGQRIAQIREEIVGIRAQEVASRKRINLLGQEIVGIRELVNKGFVPKPRLLALERELVESEGRLGELVAQTARARQTIAESEINILSLQNDVQNEIAQALRDTQNQIHDLTEKIQAASHVLTRTEIKAPEAGIVTDLRIHTPGGVVGAGQPLLDLVPPNDRLIVTAQVRPEDIELVRPGLVAHVRLIPFHQRRTPPVDGKVIYVSADRLVDPKAGVSYYAAKVEVDEAMLKRLDHVEMVPGMPAEVMIKTGESTVAFYALAPIIDSFNRAFRED
jgi:HlyD family secretion protein